MRQSIRAAPDIWENLRSKRGPELLKALADELAALHRLCADLERAVRQSGKSADPAAHLLALDDAVGVSAALPGSVDLYASQLFEPQEGFYNLEYTADGVPFRWTGPQRYFSFTVNVDRSAALLAELEIINMVDEQRQSDMTLLVDGSSLPFRVQQTGAGYLGRAMLPAVAPRDTTTLTLVVPATLRPPAPSTDIRELGIAFSRLRIGPAGREAAESKAVAERANGLLNETTPDTEAVLGAAAAPSASRKPAKAGGRRRGLRQPGARANA